MVKRYHGSFPSFSYEFDSRYPLHFYLIQNTLWRARLGRFCNICIGMAGADDSHCAALKCAAMPKVMAWLQARYPANW